MIETCAYLVNIAWMQYVLALEDKQGVASVSDDVEFSVAVGKAVAELDTSRPSGRVISPRLRSFSPH